MKEWTEEENYSSYIFNEVKGIFQFVCMCGWLVYVHLFVHQHQEAVMRISHLRTVKLYGITIATVSTATRET